MSKPNVKLTELVLDDSVALVEAGSKADQHFRGLGYKPASGAAKSAPADAGGDSGTEAATKRSPRKKVATKRSPQSA